MAATNAALDALASTDVDAAWSSSAERHASPPSKEPKSSKPKPPRATKPRAKQNGGDSIATANTKLERSRAKERRKYYRKKERLTELQQQAAVLERRLLVLKGATETLDEFPDNESYTPSVANSPMSRREQLEVMTLELSKTKAMLRNENTQLRRQYRMAIQQASYLSDLLNAEHQLYRAHSAYFRLLAPLTQEKCSALHEHSSATVLAFSQSTLDAPLAGTMADWRGMRVVHGNMFKFAIEKTFSHKNAKFASSQVFAVLVDPSRNRRIFSDELGKRVRLVQKVDDDNYVFLEEMRVLMPGANGQFIKSALLKSRFRTENGYRIHTRALDRRMIEMEDLLSGDPVVLPHELWSPSNQLTWIEFEDVGDDSVTVKFAGILPTIGATAYFWMAEVVLLCLRCERAILGPRFALPAI